MRLKFQLCLIFLLVSHILSFSQAPTQSIRGVVLDADSQVPLIGATVQVVGFDSSFGTTTDLDGEFSLSAIPVGRQTLLINYLGYESSTIPSIIISSGKETVLTITMQESITALEEVVITAEVNKQETLNEMTTLSGRSFSVEETQRYAASLLDPARMAQNYAGVTSSGDNLSNEIVIRGNSPAYVQWRIEGIQVPGPNHYASKGSSGGGISMLSSSMLGNSDFYTGAFPADMGNALAGAFDLNFRNGNNTQREHSFQFGVIGIEASTEGPFSKKSKASYLINYRYSALGLIQKITDLNFGDAQINFQDISFKINLPTKKYGSFSIFGLGGLSNSSNERDENPTSWRNNGDLFQYSELNSYALFGVSHKYLFKNQKTYIKTVLANTLDRYERSEDFIDLRKNSAIVDDEIEDLKDQVTRLSFTLNHKESAKHSFRTGMVISHLNYSFLNSNRIINGIGNFEFEYGPATVYVDSEGSTNMLQAFAMHKYRAAKDWTINYGVHFTHFALSKSSALEPRLGVKWQFSKKQSVAISVGLHSQAEHLLNYALQRQQADGSFFQPNLVLELTKAAHFVVGYDHSFTSSLRLKVEAYYQSLYDVPMDTSFVAGSILNAENVYDVIYDSRILTNVGKGQNIGIDLTLEKFMSNGYYYLLTGSLFDSSITGLDGEKYNTRYNSKFNLTLLAGKEYKVGKAGKNTLAINGKILYYGGNRYSEWDFTNGNLTEGGFYKLQADPYYRFDASLNYRVNKKSTTHIFSLEIQNFTNHRNIEDVRPDFSQGNYFTVFQSGIIPNINYRVEF